MVVRSQTDARGVPIRIEDYELDRPTLEMALSLMARYIQQRHQSVTVIAVGGAVNVLLLQNRQSTHDIKFFGTNVGTDERILLSDASRYAEQNSTTPLGSEWYNNQTMLWLPANIHRTVTEEALQQDEVVYDQQGLKILAAPWNYAMCGKMDRLMSRDETRPYDTSDAATYLHHYIERNGQRPVTNDIVKGWCRSYHKQTSDAIIKSVNKEYRRRYGGVGIVK